MKSDFVKFTDFDECPESYIQYISKKIHNHESYALLCVEIILSAFGDILPIKLYQYHTINYLKQKSQLSRRLLKKHNESINWLMNGQEHWSFQFFGFYDENSMIKIQKAISKKFNS